MEESVEKLEKIPVGERSNQLPQALEDLGTGWRKQGQIYASCGRRD